MAPVDESGREIDVVHAEAATAPTQTSVAVPTTASTNTSPYGYSQAQADDIVTAVNALVADVAAIVAFLGTIHTAATEV